MKRSYFLMDWKNHLKGERGNLESDKENTAMVFHVLGGKGLRGKRTEGEKKQLTKYNRLKKRRRNWKSVLKKYFLANFMFQKTRTAYFLETIVVMRFLNGKNKDSGLLEHVLGYCPLLRVALLSAACEALKQSV